jgi:putative ATPase
MEDGTILLVGATTENPSFELNAALLSRAQVLVLNRWTPRRLEQMLARAPRPSLTGPAADAEARKRCWRWPMAMGARC